MRELEHLLPELDPPPGGLVRLQRSLQAHREPTRAHRWHWLPAAAGTCALVLLAFVWWYGPVGRQRRTDALTQALLQAATLPPLTDGIRVTNGAALLLPSGQANARVYLIASTPATEH